MQFEIENGILKKYTGDATDVVVPDNVTEIGARAFEDNTALVSVTVRGGIVGIGCCAFCNCVNLKHVYINEGTFLKTIGRSAFYNCKNLESFTVPDNTEEIGEDAFYRCSKLSTESQLLKINMFLTLKDGAKAVECAYGRKEASQILKEASCYRLKKEICDGNDLKIKKAGTMNIKKENILVENGHFIGCVFKGAKLLVRNMARGERMLLDTVVKGVRGDTVFEDLIYLSLC